jgi:CRISPR-associated endonuclease/helicase Cas3
LLALVELLKVKNNIKKVFYVFPYINIITQTKDTLVNNLELSSDEYIELYSKASFGEHDLGDESPTDYEIKYYLDILFGNFPMSFISHIKFFNILGTSKNVFFTFL